jgi:hypothetical protein
MRALLSRINKQMFIIIQLQSMSSVLIEDEQILEDINPEQELQQWKELFDVSHRFEHLRDSGDQGVEFWSFMKRYNAGKIEDGDESVRSHGTMGWSYMYAAPIQEEHNILWAFYRSVYVLEHSICLAPALTRPYFLWFSDVDIKQSIPLEMPYVMRICRIAVACVASCFPRLQVC